ncbi:MAG TPA: hypothetical protein PLR50_00135 [Candidatus Rifleibacterium sp.]|nr:hypothetical protein [Candidatus Rifleibacterium sp.]
MMKNRFAISILVFIVLAVPGKLPAIDLFAWLGMAGQPLAISAPDWSRRGSLLRLEYDTHEYYKRWIDDRLVNDFSGNGYHAGLTAQLLPDLAVGVRKKFAEPQTWLNNISDKSDRFNMKSESESGEVFLRLFRGSQVLEAGSGSGKSYFTGEYDLHPDIINALGANPPIYLNNGETRRYASYFNSFGRWRLRLGLDELRFSHRVSAETPAMNVVLNHGRKLSRRSAELAWQNERGISPYLRYDTERDLGDGENFRDIKFKIGNNRSEVDLSALSFGGVYRHRGTRFFAEFSQLSFSADLENGTNLITLNPLFLFGTNRVAYRVDYHPENPWAIRFGGQRVYRGVEYFVQYSYSSLSGVATTWSSKDYDMFAKTATDITLNDTTVDLHRFALCATRPDRSGRWQARLHLLAPIVESTERKSQILPPPGPAPAPPVQDKPEETARGGWQLTIAREFKL